MRQVLRPIASGMWAGPGAWRRGRTLLTAAASPAQAREVNLSWAIHMAGRHTNLIHVFAARGDRGGAAPCNRQGVPRGRGCGRQRGPRHGVFALSALPAQGGSRGRVASGA